MKKELHAFCTIPGHEFDIREVFTSQGALSREVKILHENHHKLVARLIGMPVKDYKDGLMLRNFERLNQQLGWAGAKHQLKHFGLTEARLRRIWGRRNYYPKTMPEIGGKLSVTIRDIA